jgi:hypothetical protein
MFGPCANARCLRGYPTPPISLWMTRADENPRDETLLTSADLSPELVAALDHAVATQTQRDPASPASRAQLIARILTQWLRVEGHLRHGGGDEGLRPEDLTSENDL